MGLLNKTTKNDFEKRFASGYNVGAKELIGKIPFQMRDNALLTLSGMMEMQPKNVELKGMFFGFSESIQREKAKRLKQYHEYQKQQGKQQSRER